MQSPQHSAVGLTNLPCTRNPGRQIKEGSITPSPSPCLQQGTTAACGRTALPIICSGKFMSLMTLHSANARAGPLSLQGSLCASSPMVLSP